MSELTREKIYKKELEKVGGEGNNNLERIRSLGGGAALEDIVDKNGNHRFIEGEGTLETISGVTFTYNKWSLSGTHLMVVLAGTIAMGTTISFKTLSTYNVPDFIKDKIFTIFDNVIDVKTLTAYKSGGSSQTGEVQFIKTDDGLRLFFNQDQAFTGGDRLFRLQFDLLIDNE